MTPVLVLYHSDPCPLLGPTWVGGMLSVYRNKIYWGTMTIGSVYAGAYNVANPALAMTPAIRDNMARTLYARAAHVFRVDAGDPANPRSEEHTSELQSLMRISYAVFCLKKKTTQSSLLLLSNQLF